MLLSTWLTVLHKTGWKSTPSWSWHSRGFPASLQWKIQQHEAYISTQQGLLWSWGAAVPPNWALDPASGGWGRTSQVPTSPVCACELAVFGRSDWVTSQSPSFATAMIIKSMAREMKTEYFQACDRKSTPLYCYELCKFGCKYMSKRNGLCPLSLGAPLSLAWLTPRGRKKCTRHPPHLHLHPAPCLRVTALLAGFYSGCKLAL